MIVLLDKELADGSLSRNTCKLAEKVLKETSHPTHAKAQLSHLLGTKMNRYQLCAKYGWAFSSDMPDRYIERKGIIFDQIAEKGDVDQTTRLQKENRNLMEKMETIGTGIQ